jgi:hypothetical protein
MFYKAINFQKLNKQTITPMQFISQKTLYFSKTKQILIVIHDLFIPVCLFNASYKSLYK